MALSGSFPSVLLPGVAKAFEWIQNRRTFHIIYEIPSLGFKIALYCN